MVGCPGAGSTVGSAATADSNAEKDRATAPFRDALIEFIIGIIDTEADGELNYVNA